MAELHKSANIEMNILMQFKSVYIARTDESIHVVVFIQGTFKTSPFGPSHKSGEGILKPYTLLAPSPSPMQCYNVVCKAGRSLSMRPTLSVSSNLTRPMANGCLRTHSKDPLHHSNHSTTCQHEVDSLMRAALARSQDRT